MKLLMRYLLTITQKRLKPFSGRYGKGYDKGEGKGSKDVYSGYGKDNSSDKGKGYGAKPFAAPANKVSPYYINS